MVLIVIHVTIIIMEQIAPSFATKLCDTRVMDQEKKFARTTSIQNSNVINYVFL